MEAGRFEEPEYQEVSCKTVSPRNGFIVKLKTIAISMNILILTGKLSRDPTPRQKTIGSYWLLGEEDATNYWLSNIKWSAIKPYTHKPQNEVIRLHLSNKYNQRQKSSFVWGRIDGGVFVRGRKGIILLKLKHFFKNSSLFQLMVFFISFF